jgi:hypothetical protein
MIAFDIGQTRFAYRTVDVCVADGYTPGPGASGDGIRQSLAAHGIHAGGTACDARHLPGTRDALPHGRARQGTARAPAERIAQERRSCAMGRVELTASG